VGKTTGTKRSAIQQQQATLPAALAGLVRLLARQAAQEAANQTQLPDPSAIDHSESEDPSEAED
jgi:hypothetical protein